MADPETTWEPVSCPTPGFGIFETNWGAAAPMAAPLHNSDTPPELTPCK